MPFSPANGPPDSMPKDLRRGGKSDKDGENMFSWIRSSHAKNDMALWYISPFEQAFGVLLDRHIIAPSTQHCEALCLPSQALSRKPVQLHQFHWTPFRVPQPKKLLSQPLPSEINLKPRPTLPILQPPLERATASRTETRPAVMFNVAVTMAPAKRRATSHTAAPASHRILSNV